MHAGRQTGRQAVRQIHASVSGLQTCVSSIAVVPPPHGGKEVGNRCAWDEWETFLSSDMKEQSGGQKAADSLASPATTRPKAAPVNARDACRRASNSLQPSSCNDKRSASVPVRCAPRSAATPAV